jgi:hypothetical protein
MLASIAKRKAESAHDLLTNCTGRVSFTRMSF